MRSDTKIYGIFRDWSLLEGRGVKMDHYDDCNDGYDIRALLYLRHMLLVRTYKRGSKSFPLFLGYRWAPSRIWRANKAFIGFQPPTQHFIMIYRSCIAALFTRLTIL